MARPTYGFGLVNCSNSAVIMVTHTVNGGELGKEALKALLQSVRESEFGRMPNKSILRSPFASSGMGCAALEEGTDNGECSIFG